MRFQESRGPARIEREVTDELEFHLAERAADLERAGLSPHAAREEAERRFGDLEEARRELASIDRRRRRGERRAEWWNGLFRDARYGIRGLVRERGFTVAVVLTLGFGVGATAAMFGIIDRLLLKPPAHISDPGRVGRLYFTDFFKWYGLATQESTSYPDFLTLRDGMRSLCCVVGYFPRAASIGRGTASQRVQSVAASGEYFELLGVQPRLGRFFGREVDEPGTRRLVAVVSEGFWRRHFGAAPDVIGRSIELDRQRFEIVGVAPAGFTGVGLSPVDVWVPLRTMGDKAVGKGWEEAYGWRWVRVVGRLAPDRSPAQATAEATALYRATLEERKEPDTLAAVRVGSVLAARGPTDEAEEGRIALWLGGVALLVLLIACANAANLLLARSIRRRREIGVRLALGVGRWRLVRQLLVETLVLAGLGGGIGVALAYWGGGTLARLLLPGVTWQAGLLDGRLLAAASTLVVAVAILTGLAPAWQALSQDVVGSLKAGARSGLGKRSRVRDGLVLLQATLSVVLLVGAGLFVRSLRNLRAIDLGFDADRVLLVDVDVESSASSPPPGFRSAKDAAYHRIRDRLATLPTVEVASVAFTAPFWSARSARLSIPGVDSIPSSRDGGPYVNAVTPEFFATMGMRIVRGRGFDDMDGPTASPVVAVTETFARIVWPGSDPIGRCMKIGADTMPCAIVVGVAQDARRLSLTSDAPVMQYYIPLDQERLDPSLRTLLVRTRGDPGMASAEVRRVVQATLVDAPYPTVTYLADLAEPQLRPWTLGATLFGVFGLLALVLAALGLYSVVAYTVAQRTHEMGVRVALGGTGGDLVRLVIGGTLRVVGLGLAIGLLVALVAGRWVEPLLYRVSPRDPGVLLGVAGTLLVVGLLASLVPARRARRVSPMEVLRAE